MRNLKKKKKIEAVDGWYWDYDIEFELKIYKKKKGKKKIQDITYPQKLIKLLDVKKGIDSLTSI